MAIPFAIFGFLGAVVVVVFFIGIACEIDDDSFVPALVVTFLVACVLILIGTWNVNAIVNKEPTDCFALAGDSAIEARLEENGYRDIPTINSRNIVTKGHILNKYLDPTPDDVWVIRDSSTSQESQYLVVRDVPQQTGEGQCEVDLSVIPYEPAK